MTRSARLRPRVVRQREAQDCAAAALATACGYFGPRPSLRTLRRLLDVQTDGASLGAVAEVAEHLGMSAAGLRLSYEDLRGREPPFIAPLGPHFVVLHRVDAERVEVGDPALGWRRLSRAQFCQRWAGVVLELRAGSPLPLSLQEAPLARRLLRVLAPFRGALLAVLGLTLLLNTLTLLIPVLTQQVVDRLTQGTTRAPLAPALLGLALGSAVEVLRGRVVNRVSMRVQLHLGQLLLKRLYALPLAYFAARQTGDSLQRMDEAQRLGSFLGERGAEALVDCLLAVLALLVCAAYSKVVALGLLVGGALLLALAGVLLARSYRRVEEACLLQSAATSQLMEGVRRIALLRSHGATDAQARRFLDTSRAAAGATLVARDQHNTLSVATQLVLRAAPLWVVLVGAGRLTMGALLALTAIVSVVVSGLANLAGCAVEAGRVLLGVARVLDVLEEEPDPEGDAPLVGRGGALELRGVCFRYQERGPLVLREVDLRVSAGSTVALVGRSGAGKSTLALLLLRLLRPSAGSILLQGQDLQSVVAADLRRQVALVPQDCALLRGTVLENIALGDERPDRERAQRAARRAQAEEFILAHPQGLDRMLHEDGAGLSAGQRQRLAIARALYRDPAVLILDEPTSALDPESERALVQALSGLRGRVTVLIIAHRLRTIVDADRIYLLRDGRVVEAGTHEELSAQAGYQALWRAGEGAVAAVG